jgi:hypothetical protein
MRFGTAGGLVKHVPFAVAAVLFAFAASGVQGTATGTLPAEADAYLRKAGFTAAELASLAGGQVIARVESTGDTGELFTVGAVSVRSTREQTAAYYDQLISYVDGQVTLGFGRFTNPPTLENVKTLTLDDDEIDAIRTCKPRDCDLQISGEGLQTIRREIDWKAPDVMLRVQAAVRQAMVNYVAAYMQRGDDALVTYIDTSSPVSLKNEWRGILANSRYFQDYVPALREYLLSFPQPPLPGGHDVFYWVKEAYGLKPTVSIVHSVIYHPPQQQGRITIAQKQIYASHYYDGSLALANLYETVDQGRPTTVVVYANRSRGDLLKGGFGGLKRKIARAQARTAAIDTLATIQTQLEKAASH